jgi:periplasmic divalent cation tolerance protein
VSTPYFTHSSLLMLLLISTFPNKPRDLKRFTLGLIKGGLAACVSRIQYVKSTYMREGKLMQEEEKVLLITLPTTNKDKVIGYFKKNHPYDTPKLLRFQPDDVDAAYRDFVLTCAK